MNWPLLNFIALLVILVGLAAGAWVLAAWLRRNAPTWTGPGQADAVAALKREFTLTIAQVVRDLADVRRDGHTNKEEIDNAHRKADAVARETIHFQRVIQDTGEHQLKMSAKIEAKLEEVLSLRDKVDAVENKADQIEKDVSGLACFMRDSQTLPGFCPLHKVECPLTPAKGTPVAVVKKVEADDA